MREPSNGEPHPDEVFGATPDIRGGVACFTGTRVGEHQQTQDTETGDDGITA